MQNKKIIISVFCLPILCGCSVFMAANKSGTSIEKLGECRTRTCILSKDASPVHTKKDKKGNVIEESYHVKKPTGSAARSVMHGVLDVATFGIWEVAGTPIEGTLNKKDFYAIRVFYQEDGETIKAVQLN